MKVILTPEFSDLFPGETADVGELLAGIQSKLIIQLMALINAELYSNDQGEVTQVKILNIMMTLQPPEVKMKIIGSAMEKMHGHPEQSTYFFTPSYCMNFMHYELTHFRDLPDIDLTAEQELNTFKAYFLITEQYARDKKQEMPEVSFDDPHYFGKLMWPSLIAAAGSSVPLEPKPLSASR